MAGEVGHVVYAARILDYLDDSVKSSEYWAGTLFPDIRHLGVVSRHRTHPEDVSLYSLVGKNDFITGMRVHSWIDQTREVFLRKENIKESLPWHPFVPHALKLVEDELLYDIFDDWNVVKRALNKVYEEELNFTNDKQRIAEWHQTLRDYLKEKPTDDSRFALTLAIGLSEKVAEELNSVVRLLQEDKATQMTLQKFWQHLENILV